MPVGGGAGGGPLGDAEGGLRGGRNMRLAGAIGSQVKGFLGGYHTPGGTNLPQITSPASSITTRGSEIGTGGKQRRLSFSTAMR